MFTIFKTLRTLDDKFTRIEHELIEIDYQVGLILKKLKDLPIHKKCSCGRTVKLDKTIAKENEAGYWQNCECKSTLLFTHDMEK